MAPNKGLACNKSWEPAPARHMPRTFPAPQQLLSLREVTRGAAMGEGKRLECVRSRQEEGFKKEGTVTAITGQVKTRMSVVYGFGLNWSIDGHS